MGALSDNWTEVLSDPRFVTFEDPFSGFAVPKDEFHATYGPACLAVFQDHLLVSHLFEPNPLTVGEWRFADNEGRLDLYDAAVESGLVQPFDEVCAGETDAERRGRRPYALETIGDRDHKEQRLETITALLEDDGLSSNQRKKRVREKRGLEAALEALAAHEELAAGGTPVDDLDDIVFMD
eukprot:m.301102 g.301102  ORF g.301102 m.301102 type:complete len:181 (-) comp27265_c1_seq1:1944-2486(-)